MRASRLHRVATRSCPARRNPTCPTISAFFRPSAAPYLQPTDASPRPRRADRPPRVARLRLPLARVASRAPCTENPRATPAREYSRRDRQPPSQGGGGAAPQTSGPAARPARVALEDLRSHLRARRASATSAELHPASANPGLPQATGSALGGGGDRVCLLPTPTFAPVALQRPRHRHLSTLRRSLLRRSAVLAAIQITTFAWVGGESNSACAPSPLPVELRFSSTALSSPRRSSRYVARQSRPTAVSLASCRLANTSFLPAPPPGVRPARLALFGCKLENHRPRPICGARPALLRLLGSV